MTVVANAPPLKIADMSLFNARTRLVWMTMARIHPLKEDSLMLPISLFSLIVPLASGGTVIMVA